SKALHQVSHECCLTRLILRGEQHLSLPHQQPVNDPINLLIGKRHQVLKVEELRERDIAQLLLSVPSLSVGIGTQLLESILNALLVLSVDLLKRLRLRLDQLARTRVGRTVPQRAVKRVPLRVRAVVPRAQSLREHGLSLSERDLALSDVLPSLKCTVVHGRVALSLWSVPDGL